MNTYRRYCLQVGEFYFDEIAVTHGLDIVRHCQRPAPVPTAACVPFFTIHIDLRLDESTLLAALKKDTRYEIRRAGDKDHLQEQVWSDDIPNDVLTDFIGFYRSFATCKGLPPADERRIRSLVSARQLWFTKICGAGGETLVWHAYISSGAIARLLLSASLLGTTADSAERQRLGRANRLLHWADLLRFKASGFRTLDMGGWYEGQSDAERLKINNFKEEFGGTVVRMYNADEGVTLRGKLALEVLRWRQPSRRSGPAVLSPQAEGAVEATSASNPTMPSQRS